MCVFSKDERYLNSFMQYCRDFRGLSVTTLNEYSSTLKEWRSVSINDNEKQTISYAARDFAYSLKLKGLENKTVNNKLAVMSQFFRYLCMIGVADYNPFADIHRLSVAKHLPACPTESQVLAAIKAIDWSTWKGCRAIFSVIFLFRTGLRCHELTSLKWEDVLNDNIFVRNGKGGKDRLVPVIHDLKKFINWYKPMSRSEYVISDESGKKVCDRELRRIIESALISLPKAHRHPHALRHAFATTLLEHGVNIYSIKDMLGHSSVKTTEIYTHLSTKFIREDYERAFINRQ